MDGYQQFKPLVGDLSCVCPNDRPVIGLSKMIILLSVLVVYCVAAVIITRKMQNKSKKYEDKNEQKDNDNHDSESVKNLLEPESTEKW